MKKDSKEKITTGILSFGCLISIVVFAAMIFFFINGFVLLGIASLFILGAMNMGIDSLEKWEKEDAQVLVDHQSPLFFCCI